MPSVSGVSYIAEHKQRVLCTVTVGETTGSLERQVTIIIMDMGARIETIIMILVL